MNYYPGRDGHISELDEDLVTSSELLARHLPNARVVKAFNRDLASGGRRQQPGTAMYATDLTAAQAAEVLTQG